MAADLFAQSPPKPVDGIRIGIGGWTFAPWRGGMFYPQGLVQRRELEYASRRLTAIEINGTYYGTQKPATYAKWRDETPEGFMFSAKAPKRIMASRTLAKTGPQVDDFIGGIAGLGDRLGPLVWQFEATRRLDADDFSAFLELLPKQAGNIVLRHVLDVRDPAFVDADYLALAKRHGMATVFTDSPDHPSFADVTADFVYARLMRSRAGITTGYDDAALARWAARIRLWSSGGEPDDLPRICPASKPDASKPDASKPDASAPAASEPAARQRDVFVYFISAAKERNPAAAMALLGKLES